MDHDPPHHCDECVFCLSVCPACGSTQVDVRLATAYGYRNDHPDRLQLWRVEQSASMHCRRCGADFAPDHSAMGRLARAAAAVVGVAPCVEIETDERGVIRRRSFHLRPGRRQRRSPPSAHPRAAEATSET